MLPRYQMVMYAASFVSSFQTFSTRPFTPPLLAGAAPPETDCRRNEKLWWHWIGLLS